MTAVSQDQPRVKRKGSADLTRSTGAGWSFLAPFLVIYVLFLIYPVIQAVIMGFYDWDFLDISDRTFIGFENYGRMLWGTNMTWDLQHLWLWRLAGLAPIPFLWRAVARRSLSRRSAIGLTILLVLIFGVAMGIHLGQQAM